MTSLFCCPLCAQPLVRQERTYRCPGGHSFDIAREGHTHLLPVNRKHSAAPGDDPGMARARREFLSKGYYSPLLNTLCNLSVAHTGSAPAILDAGCGEGYYTAGIRQALLDAGKSPRMAGIDISKAILRLAAKRTGDVEFAVASCYRLPLADSSVELLLDCFSPLSVPEFRRVLRGGGTFLYVVPAAEHLWEMKQVLYDRPYRNEEKEVAYEGFTLQEVVGVEAMITLPCQEDIHALFQMTPYYWKTPKEGAARLAALDSLTTHIAFHVHVFRRDA
ncbi:putative RNA methyltransferase [Dysosmobacter sp.]|uniref:putative RNA methyltransferase n=1 Tax=Dysosmobacter sp. TaxID=2591382 RepID=UPI002A8DE46F|nr:methyltransferase domain-containing protein [Dysosmobacter sp.]MDY3280916.1 methyltransferase domain-containing protein [Dysosmobacter sp.]